MGYFTRSAILQILSVLMALLTPAAAQEGGHVPILAYHRFGPTVADSMTVRTAVFDDQLRWLQGHGYAIIPLRRLVGALRDPEAPVAGRAVVITVDDGHRSVYTDMFPLIKRNRFPVTLFIYPSAISNASYALTWQQLAEMAQSGLVDIQSHTYWHPNFNHERARLAPEAYHAFVMMQLTRSKEVLESRVGATVDLLAWPFGIVDPELEKWAQAAGYVAAFTLERKPAGRESHPLALPRYLMTDADQGARFAAIIEGSGGEATGR
jgi:peptidoglycan/xylan/chitin deacetylase (PgdA/CDA1 family)